MGHGRTEGHKVEFTTIPQPDAVVLTNSITRGESDRFDFTLGAIVGSMQGDLLLSVYFEDGEEVHERVDMNALLQAWIGEIVHSKQMRGEMTQEAP